MAAITACWEIHLTSEQLFVMWWSSLHAPYAVGHDGSRLGLSNRAISLKFPPKGLCPRSDAKTDPGNNFMLGRLRRACLANRHQV